MMYGLETVTLTKRQDAQLKVTEDKTKAKEDREWI